jgi:hypothetical protein
MAVERLRGATGGNASAVPTSYLNVRAAISTIRDPIPCPDRGDSADAGYTLRYCGQR